MATGREMSEHTWLKCRNPGTMLAFLGKRLSERKRRLFACACCHKVRDQIDDRSWNAVLVAERYADGLATADDLDDAAQVADDGGGPDGR